MSGIPIQVTRTYDSRNKFTSGDFGYGWNVDLGKGVRVEKSANLGKWWQQTSDGNLFFPTYCLQPSRALFVTVTFPDGKAYRFQAGTDQQCQALFPLERRLARVHAHWADARLAGGARCRPTS